MEPLKTPPKTALFDRAVQRKINEIVATLNSGGGGGGIQNVFIQSNQPTASGAYLWIDTTGGNLNFKVEDGE